MLHSGIRTVQDRPDTAVDGGRFEAAASLLGAPADGAAPRAADSPAAPVVKDGALHYQRCRWCRTAAFGRVLCAVCGSTEWDWERSSGTGIVRRSSVVHRNTDRRHNQSLIDMAEGFRLHCRVVGAASGSVRVGSRVRLATSDSPTQRELVFRVCADDDADRPRFR
ncbi:OB-fold domain-containing protein [Streptomyces sp. B1866]|uniref:Zn-ribbon domain-containing OB-fold protein n=1 Tax=Streptomyces sp. B1866 TaxID=3075431 RepID=UPI00288DD213|nr:OB-fold domain-containing protein [Streptomyces sp. B1866]MDT3398209.1 OB-fold domain-containing protein [Streptomyces sp. B1866]